LHFHISSVDVYSDLTSPETTREDSTTSIAEVSHYGFHKLLAEQTVQHYARNWLIARLAGMVGPGLRKNPVYDILHGDPLRIHPRSQYQFMNTADMARIAWTLVERGLSRETFNLCGDGVISPFEIARLAGRELDLSMLEPTAQPRVVNINTEKICKMMPIPSTRETVAGFLSAWSQKQELEGRRSWAI
jgi:nucleoside-diphosphate-sugar epimerase